MLEEAHNEKHIILSHSDVLCTYSYNLPFERCVRIFTYTTVTPIDGIIRKVNASYRPCEIITWMLTTIKLNGVSFIRAGCMKLTALFAAPAL